MWLNQNKNQESEVCDNIINHAANEAVKVLENIWRLSGGAREEAEAKSDHHPPSPHPRPHQRSSTYCQCEAEA